MPGSIRDKVAIAAWVVPSSGSCGTRDHDLIVDAVNEA